MASAPHDSLPPLDQLQRHIDEVKREVAQHTPQEGSSAMGGDRLTPAMRIGVELVAGMVVGIGAGYLLDRWQDTSPWYTILFFFLGCAAGLRNIKRLSS